MSRFRCSRSRRAALVAAILVCGATVSASGQEKKSFVQRPSDPFPGSGSFPGYGKKIRVSIEDRNAPLSIVSGSPWSVMTYTGRLSAWNSDSMALTTTRGERLEISRAQIARLDTAAGHKSRFIRALLGIPIGASIGGLLGKPGSHTDVISLAALGIPVGFVLGAASGGQRWRRVNLAQQPGIAASRQ